MSQIFLSLLITCDGLRDIEAADLWLVGTFAGILKSQHDSPLGPENYFLRRTVLHLLRCFSKTPELCSSADPFVTSKNIFSDIAKCLQLVVVGRKIIRG